MSIKKIVHFLVLPLPQALFMLFPLSAISQENALDKGWEAFYTNKLPYAHDFFLEAGKDKSTQAEALLALSILSSLDKTHTDAFNYFTKFYETSTSSLPYLLAFWNTPSVFEGNTKKSDEQLKLLHQLTKDPKTDGTIKALAYSMLGNHYEISGNDKASVAAFNQIGSMENWQIAGEFENISGSGFDKNYPPVYTPENTKNFTNKFGANVTWFNLFCSRRDKWIDFDYLFSYKETISFAQSFVESPTDRVVQLRIGTSGSLKAWVNDYLVYNEPTERNNDIDTYIIKVKLHKGYNRILLQLGESDLGRLNFMARLTNDNGDPLTELKTTNAVQPYTKETAYQPQTVALADEEFFKKSIAEYPQKMVNYIALIESYMRNGKYPEAKKIITRAQKLAPNCSYLYNKLMALYNLEGNSTGWDEAFSRLKEIEPSNLHVLNITFDANLKKKNYTDAATALTKIEQLYGIDEYTAIKRVDLIGKTKSKGEWNTALNMAYSKYPNDYTIVELKHYQELNSQNNYDGAINVLQEYLDKKFKLSIVITIAEDYVKKGDLNGAIRTMRNAVEKYPYTTGYVRKLGDYYYQKNDYDNAEHWYKEALKVAPYSRSTWAAIGKLYETRNQNKDAIEAYKKAVNYSHGDFDYQRTLRRLENKKEVYSYFENPDADQRCKNAPNAADYPEDNSVILHQEIQKIVYSQGVWEEKHVLLVKLFDAEAIGQWKEYKIPYFKTEKLQIETAEAIKTNGSKIKAETHENQVVFTSLEPGDAIYLVYKLEDQYASNNLVDYFTDSYYFSSGIPYLESKYSLLIDPAIKFKAVFSRDTIQPEISKKEEFDMYVWEKKNQSSDKYEDKMPPFADVAQVLSLSSIPDWKQVSNWYADIALPKAQVDDDVKETVAKLFENKTDTSCLEKVKTIYSYIVNNIRYSSVPFLQNGIVPQKAAKVLNTKIGDCKDVATLFVAMCKEAGINASLVLVNTADRGKNAMPLPAIQFNHAIAQVNINGDKYYADLTSNYAPFNLLSSALLNAFSLEIKDEKDTGNTIVPVLLDTPTKVKSIYTYDANIDIIDEETVKVKYTSVKVGMESVYMRYKYKNIGKQQQEKMIQEAIALDFPSVELNDFEIKNLEAQGDTVKSFITYTGHNAFKEAGGLKLLSFPWGSKAHPQDFVFSNKRKFPISLIYFLNNDCKETISMTIPPGKKLGELPKNVSYSCDYADYKLTFKLVGNKVLAERSFKYKKDIVPSDKVADFKIFYNKVIAADAKELVFKT